MRKLLALLLALTGPGTLLGCGGPEATSTFAVENADGGGMDAGPTVIRAAWSYRSTEVDVDLFVVTTESPDGCATTGRLVINTLTASEQIHDLEETACPTLRLSQTGDIVLYDSPTGHDWSLEQLRVDTDLEVIELGPWTPDVGDGAAYRFTLSAPDCGNGCDCPQLRRRFGSEDSILILGERCP